MRLSDEVKGYGYPSLKDFSDTFNLDEVTIKVLRIDKEARRRFMTEKIKIPKGATYVDNKKGSGTGIFYKEGSHGFIYWWDNECKTWDRSHRIGGLKGLQKIQFYEYEG